MAAGGGVAEEAVELMPGDPRLPRTAPDGTPWPPEAGALRVKARYLLATKDGREAYEVAKAFGAEQGFSIGYRVRHARKVGRVRHIDDLDLYEFSPVLHGANRLARLVSIKGGPPPRLETKATTGTPFALHPRRRCGFPCGGRATAGSRPFHHHRSGAAVVAPIAVAAKGFDSTGSKLTDSVREVEAMADVRLPTQFIMVVIDGIGSGDAAPRR